MGKFSNTWSLMGASWEVLKKDKELLIFPLISGVCCLLVIASFVAPIYLSGNWQPPGESATTSDELNYYSLLFLLYFCTYFVGIFFNSAIVACAVIRMKGGDPTVMDGLRAAGARITLIVGWALVSATVGLLFRIIEDRFEKAGQIVVALLGMAWSVTSFLVIPMLVVEKVGPISALKESTRLLKNTWGEQLIGNFSFGLVFFVLMIPVFLLAVMGVIMAAPAGKFMMWGLAVVYFIGLALVQSALQAIFQTALFLYVRDNQVPPGFQAEMLRDAMRRKS